MPSDGSHFANILLGFGFILIASIAGGVFGLQYRVMRKYTVQNTSLISLFFATIVVPLIAAHFILPNWTDAIRQVGWQQNLLVFAFGFGWGLGAITYAYGFNILGMALAAAIIKGITITIGSGWPLYRRWDSLSAAPKSATTTGLCILLVGTLLAGIAGILRDRELARQRELDPNRPEGHLQTVPKPTGGVFVIGLLMVLISGVFSAFANLGYDYARPLEQAMGGELYWKATLIRWMPMYWGGMTALIIFMGGGMLKNGDWRNYFTGTLRDLLLASTMGVVHFLAQIPYGIGAYYLDKAGRTDLGTTVGFGVNIGMALIVATSIGFATGEWTDISPRAVRMLKGAILILIVAIGVLAYANSLVGS